MKHSPFTRLPSLPPMISLPAILLAACLTGCEHTAPPMASADSRPNPDQPNPNQPTSKDSIAMSIAAGTTVPAPYAATPWAKTHATAHFDTATFGAGCFWGVESAFRKIDGVAGTAVGFSGGTVNEPSYQLVCQHRTGHAEVVQVLFDPAVVSYDKLLNVFWAKHDPTQVNRQGPDYGDQYRTVIFAHSPEQIMAAEASKAALDKSAKYDAPIATQIVPFNKFWPAEDYHQQYLEKQGLDSCGTGH